MKPTWWGLGVLGFALAGLEANTTYYYKTMPGDGVERSFTTAPPTNFPPSPEPSMAGRVWKTNGDLAEESNVYLMVVKPDGTPSALLVFDQPERALAQT